MKRFALICFALLLGVLCSSCSEDDDEIIIDSAPVSAPVFLSYGEYSYTEDLENGDHNELKKVVVIKSKKEFAKYNHISNSFNNEDLSILESFDFDHSSLLLVLGIHPTSLGVLKNDITKKGGKYQIKIVFEHYGISLQAFTPWYSVYKVPKNVKASNYVVEVTQEWKEWEE